MGHEDQTANSQDVSNKYAMASENSDVLLSKVVNVIRAASSLAAQDVDFYRNLDRDFSKILQSKSSKLAYRNGERDRPFY